MDENVEKKVGIPESITIGGVTYIVKDTPELQQFIQEVAKVEKSKLYTQFENLKSQIANLSRVKVTGESVDTDAIIEKLKGTFVTKEDFKEVLPGVLREVVQPVLTATEQNRKNELAQYREKLINENIATCIPELVKGDTKEALDQALQESIRLRSAYPSPSSAATLNKPVVDPLIQQQARQMAGDNQLTPTPQTPAQTSSPMPPMTPRRPSPEVSGPANIKQMPMSEFAQKRAELEQQLQAMYGEGSL